MGEDGAEVVWVWGEEVTPLCSWALARSPVLKAPSPLPLGGFKHTHPTCEPIPDPPREGKGGPDLPAKIWVGAEGTPKMYCLETWRQKGREGLGAGISDLPRALGGLQMAPLSHSSGHGGASGGRNMGTVTMGSLECPSLAARRLKCTPMSGIWLLKGGRFHVLCAPLEQMGEPVPMDGADDNKHSGLDEDLGKEGEA